MNLPYIQSELFRGLVGMETLLKPEWRLTIYKNTKGDFDIFLHHPKAKHVYKEVWFIYSNYIKTADQITEKIKRIWDSIPAECKRDDILK